VNEIRMASSEVSLPHRLHSGRAPILGTSLGIDKPRIRDAGAYHSGSLRRSPIHSRHRPP